MSSWTNWFGQRQQSLQPTTITQILRVNAIGLEGEGLKEIIEDVLLEDRNHFEALIPRIYELGGEIPRDIRDFANMAACPDAYLPERGQGKDSSSPRVGFTSGGTEEAKEAVSEVNECSKVTSGRCCRFWLRLSAARSGFIPTSAI